MDHRDNSDCSTQTDHRLRGTPPSESRRHDVYDRWKRLFDVVGTCLGLVLAAPVMLAVALLVLATMGRPILFRHTRPGMHGRLFRILKFRTMRSIDPARGLVTDGERLTRVGRWLRATSLDELPELWNVVRGEMSLVGPRPHIVQYLDRYTPEQARRHDVRPGITGLAQVRGRNTLSWEEKFAYDVRYVEERCLRLDLRILAETVRVVLRREGIAAPGTETWEEWPGPAGWTPVDVGAAGSRPDRPSSSAQPE